MMRQLLCLVAGWTAAVGALAAAESDRPTFNRDIRPIMSDTCFRCHGPDRNARQADLRLDIREEATRPTRSGRIPIVPGDPDKSEIISRVFADGARVMPPRNAHKELTPAQKETIRRWVADGAVYEGHWTYQPVKRPAVPAVADRSRIENPIDGFIQDRLRREGLMPAHRADKRTLLRRVTLDLTGLLPTPDEMRAFLADGTPDAYDKVVDRLLSSPGYGEQRAIHWLDAVRYADTAGFHGDNPIPAWPYRDYVLQAFLKNRPFDEFTREQIAGDLLPNATVQQRVASAYNRLNRTSAEGGLQPKEYLAKYGADRVRTLSAVWMGSTLGCAECHDHRFDPFLSKDFYAMKAFFADIQETGLMPDRGARAWGATLALPTEAQRLEIARLETKLATARAHLDEASAMRVVEEQAREAELRARWQAGDLAWTWQHPIAARALGGATLTIYDQEPVVSNFYLDGSLNTDTKPGDGLIVAGGANPDRETYVVTLKPGAGTWRQLGLDVVQDESLPGARYARGADRFLLSEVEADLVESDQPARRLPFTMATVNDTPPAVSTINDPSMPPLAAIDGHLETAWGIRFGEARDPFIALRFADAVHTTEQTTIVVTLRHESELRHAVIGRFRLALTADAFAWPPTADAGRRLRSRDPSGRTTWASGLPEDMMRALRRPPEDRDAVEATAVREYLIFSNPAVAERYREVQLLETERGLVDASIPRVVTAVSGEPAQTRILPRGNWMDESAPIVEPAIPRFLGALDTKGERATRLDLANWLVTRDNPLTARTFVNRTWREFFGAGLSKVIDDLGSQGEWPTHPELLDWLAAEFMHPEFDARSTHDWDVRHIVRLIVTSDTYQQSSLAESKLDDKDPENRLLAHQNRFRIDAENVRDVILRVSGLLSDKFGGPSVSPIEPPGYLAALNFPKREYSASRGEDLYRRGVYTTWQRTFLHPSLLNFDAPTREECTVSRSTSNTPLQALDLLNDPVYVEAARVFAQHAAASAGARSPTFDGQLAWVFDRALNRAPTAEERAMLRGLYERSLKRFTADPPSARALVSEGETPLPPNVNAVRLAALSTVTRAVLNLHELITRN
jgi:uncharacterized protein DUF1553/uncharacterized protein DUF1549/cytochrome c